MSRYAEYEALAAVGDAYGRWVEANTRLDAAMDAAAGQRAAPPVDALEADFAAGLEVTRAVMAFARAPTVAGVLLTVLAITFLLGFFLNRLIKKGQDLLIRIRHLRSAVLPILAELLVQSFHIGDYERILGTK